MFLRRTIFTALLLCVFALPVFAFDIPEPNGYVTDETGNLSYEDEMSLELKIDQIEELTTAEIGILLVPTTGDEDISSVAFDVGNTWGVGKEENDNGLLILVAIDDRAWFMATGYGLEGTLPDAITKRIAENNFPPHFREGDYAGGLMAALDDIEGYLTGDPTVVATEDLSNYDSDADVSHIIWFVVLLAIALGKAIWIGASKEKKTKLTKSLASNVLLFGLGVTFTTLLLTGILVGISALFDLIAMAPAPKGGGGGRSSGSSSSKSSWSSSSSSSSWGSSSSSSGSFGGGSFGGGGSGGRW